MRVRSVVRAIDLFIEACWLLVIVAVPIYFDTMTVRIFEPDKIVLFRNVVLLMVVAVLVRGIVAIPPALARRNEERARTVTAAPSAGAEGTEGPARPPQPWWRAEIARRPLLIPVAIFAIIYSLATATSVLPWISFWGSYDRLQGLYTWLNYIAFFLILVYSLRSWSQIERIISAIVFASLPVALYGIIQHLNWDPVAWGAPVNVRVASTLGNAIFLGAYLIMCMPFTAYRLWRAVEAWRPALFAAPEPAPIVAAPAPGRAAREGRNGSGKRNARSQQRQRPSARERERDTVTLGVLHPVFPVLGYAFILLCAFAALYFCGSRGPYYGFAAAVLVVGFPLTLKFKTPYPAMGSILLFIIVAGFPQVIDSLGPFPALVLFLIGIAAIVLLFTGRLRRPYTAAALGVGLLLTVLTFPQAVNVLNPALSGQPVAQASTGQTATSTSADAQHLTSFADAGTEQVRLYIWKGSLGLIKERPLLGWGPETMIYVYAKYYPTGLGHLESATALPDRNHDELMDFLVFSGIPGLLAWLAILGTFAVMIIRILQRTASRQTAIVATVVGVVVLAHFVEGLVGIAIVSTLILLWTMFAIAAAIYARPELLGAPAPALATASGENLVAASGQGRASGKAGTRRPNRGRGAQPAAAPSGAFERLTGRQQGGLIGLILVTIAAIVVAVILFVNNVQVVRADAAYKVAQGYDAVGMNCLSLYRDPSNPNTGCGLPASATQPLTQTQQQAGEVSLQYLQLSVATLQQAIDEQPNQDMYDLQLGRVSLDLASFYLVTGNKSGAAAVYQQAQPVLMQARRLNPRNADHPMNLARMYTTWATNVDPSKWPLADKYYKIGTALARNNGRYADEWGNADLQHANIHQINPAMAAPTPRQQLALYQAAMDHFKQAARDDDRLSDARAYQGDTHEEIAALYSANPGLVKDSAAAVAQEHQAAARIYAVALKMAQSWGFELPVHTSTVPGAPNDAAVLNDYITALREANDYKPLVKPLVVQGVDVYNGQSPVQAAASAPYSTTFGPQPSAPYSPTLEQTQAVLRQKGLLK